LFIPQEVYERGEPPWDDIDIEELLTRPPELYDNTISSDLVAKQEELDEGHSKAFFFTLRGDFLHAVKSYNMWPTALFPLRRNACREFLSLLKIHRFGWD
jgi:hypothetical protein